MEEYYKLNKQLIDFFGSGIDENDFSRLSESDQMKCLEVVQTFLDSYKAGRQLPPKATDIIWGNWRADPYKE